MTDCQLLCLIVPEPVREGVVDCLIQLEWVMDFTLTRIAGYSREHQHYTAREQVAGYQHLYRFEVPHHTADESLLLAALEPVCSMTDSRYFIVPVRSDGHFADSSCDQA